MSARKVSGIAWRQVRVLIRSDILERSEEQHININDECNAALARKTGVEYTGERPQKTAQELPVIAAQELVPAATALRPVINADDPTTPAKVLREKTVAAVLKPHAVHPPASANNPAPSPHPAPEAVAGKPKKPAADKKKKESAIKKFVSTRIVRANEDAGTDAVIPKDDLYQRFERWCREHSVTPVPDRRAFTVALKNQYVIAERTIGGEPYWVNIRLK